MCKKTVLIALLCAWSSLGSAAWAHPGHEHDQVLDSNMRTWTDAKGIFELQASFISAKSGKVQLRKPDGKVVTLPITQLSVEDQQWIKNRQIEIRKLNEQAPAAKSTAASSRSPRSASGGAPDIALAFDPFVKLGAIKTRRDDRFFYVESNGIPSHPMMIGITAWQQQVPLPQKYFGDNAWQIPLHPVPAAEPASAKGRFLRGAIAVAVNGIPIFNPLNNRGDDAYLFGELDEYGGHCGRADDYHYHLAPVHLETQVGKGGIIAYALDGYPIYGYDEPNGAQVKSLDWLNGHKDSGGHYHYHASKTYPYLNGGFYGEVTEIDGQVDPQPRAQPVREGLPPLRGAKIIGFASTGPNSNKLTYDVSGHKGYVDYSIAQSGDVTFKFTAVDGSTTMETYSPRGGGSGGRGPIGGPGDGRPSRRPGDNPPGERDSNPPRRAGVRPPPPVDESPASGPVSSSYKATSGTNGPQLNVLSSAVDARGYISAACTCDGTGSSPAVEWTGAPKGTKFYALSLWHIAPDREKSYWVIYNIPAKVTSIPANATGIGLAGVNDMDHNGYEPMCSKGPGVKEYHITVYALSAEARLAPEQATRTNLLAAIKNITLAEGILTFKYERSGQSASDDSPGPGEPRMRRPGRQSPGDPQPRRAGLPPRAMD